MQDTINLYIFNKMISFLYLAAADDDDVIEVDDEDDDFKSSAKKAHDVQVGL